jgi:predicted NUDIX family phosphoesterase
LFVSSPSVEHILVVPTGLFHQLGHFQGFSPDTDRYLRTLLDPQHTSYRPRPEMETDPGFKQLIPYVLFHHVDAQGDSHLFVYVRGKGQGESRLHRKRSVGIGGHISRDDAAEACPYEEGLRRELAEEVKIDTPYEARCVGLINDDETDVGRVHLGVVHVYDVETPRVSPREEDIAEAGFRPVRELLDNLEGFETWSRIVLEALFAKTAGG